MAAVQHMAAAFAHPPNLEIAEAISTALYGQPIPEPPGPGDPSAGLPSPDAPG